MSALRAGAVEEISMERNRMSASNTKECVRELVGRRIVGVLFNALPLNDRSLASGNKTLVFEDGTGFTFSSNGSYWQESAENVRRAVVVEERELLAVQEDLRGVLDLAGVGEGTDT
jgi:hypothetical protein